MVPEKPSNIQHFAEQKKGCFRGSFDKLAGPRHSSSKPKRNTRSPPCKRYCCRRAYRSQRERSTSSATDEAKTIGKLNQQKRSKIAQEFWNRKNEEDKILQAYEAMLRGENRSLLLITGALGTGKTTLAKCSLRDRVVADGGHFITGKFDECTSLAIVPVR
jgi:DNA replication protein DnaC